MRSRAQENRSGKASEHLSEPRRPVPASLPQPRCSRSHDLDASGGFLWRGDPSSPTTFYPCGLSPPHHLILSAYVDASRKAQRRRPHLYDGVRRRPGICSGRLYQHPDRGVTLPRQSAYPSLSTAPAGKTPVSRKRQSAMSNLRATATIPIRRKRLPPLPKRSRNQTLRALSG
jgi:hypothetical protein